jgi:hypothetical protein
VSGTAVQAPPAESPDQAVDAAVFHPACAGGIRSWLTRPFVACLALLAVYATITLAFNDPRGTLGTDTGGKLATLHVMEDKGSLLPEVGYWAAPADPEGDLHPLFYSFEVDGKWVNATTLPMLYAAYPLYVVGGDRAVLLLPMIGAVLCALAAQALARRLGARTGWAAFWIMGLATPVAIYALDFWEHSLGLGLMLWGFVCFYDVAERDAGWRRAVLGGVLFGAAATMRTEALVYFLVAGVGACTVLLARRRAFGRACRRGVAMALGLVVPLALNQLLEYATVGGAMRAGRATNTANAAGNGLSTRIREAFMTTLGLNRFELNLDVLVGVIIVSLIVYGVWRLARDDDADPAIGLAAIGVAALFLVLRFTDGLGFVSGLLTASPMAAVGAFLGWRRTSRYPLLVAALALPLVWAFQYTGGAGPQWGGRYELMSGALFAIVGVVALECRRAAMIAVVTVSALVTAFGVAWLSQRSHSVAKGIDAIVARDDQAVISVEAHALREGGAFYAPARHWLTATTQRDLARAVAIVSRAGDTEFALVASDARKYPTSLGPFTKRGTQRVVFLRPDLHLDVVTYSTR